jgi:hypothetical protein
MAKRALKSKPVEDPVPAEVTTDEAKFDELVGAIFAPSAEGTGAPAFKAATADVLAEFPEPEPLVMPAPTAPPPEPYQPGTRSGVFPQAPVQVYETTQGIKSSPPVVIDTKPEEPPPPNWDNLSERTRAELETGRQQVGGTQPLREAIIPKPAPDPRSNVPEPVVEPEPALDMSKLSEQTRAELRAGAEALAKRNADYRAVLKKLADQSNDRLTAAAPPQPGDMDYNTR